MLQHLHQQEEGQIIQNNEVVLDILNANEKETKVEDASRINPGYSEVETGPTPKDYGSEIISQEDIFDEKKH